MTKKIKSIAKKVAKKTGLLVKKAGKQASRAMKSAEKEWKKEQPRRDKYTGELKEAVSKMFENGARVGSDVVTTIKKDIIEINNKNK